MRNLILILLLGAGIWSWKEGKLPFQSAGGAFDEAGNPVVWIFTIDNCGKACDMGINQLKRRRVSYEEKRIDPRNDSDPNVKLWESVGRGGFPLIVAGNERIEGSGTEPMHATMLGRSFGDEYLTGFEKRLFRKHFYEDGSPKIVMYGTDWCPYCKKLRDEFHANGVDYIEIDVDKSADKEKILNTMQISGYPATWVGYTRVNGTSLRAVEKTVSGY